MMSGFFRLFINVSVLLLILSGCTQEQKKRNTLDGKALLEVKCASCHNLDIPAKTFPDEVAPPMMAVAFHGYDFINVTTPAAKTPASIAFVKDYVFNPTKEKSFCDQKSLDDYGLMLSQKGKLTEEELEAIAIYMFAHYNQENFLKIMERRRILKEMDPGELLARQQGCLGCHGVDKKKVGPIGDKPITIHLSSNNKKTLLKAEKKTIKFLKQMKSMGVSEIDSSRKSLSAGTGFDPTITHLL